MCQSMIDPTKFSRNLVKYGGSQLIHRRKTLDVARLLIFMVRSGCSSFARENPPTNPPLSNFEGGGRFEFGLVWWVIGGSAYHMA